MRPFSRLSKRARARARIVRVEGQPAQGMRGEEAEIAAGIVLGHQDEVALDLRRATEAEKGLAEPVPGLALQLAIARLLRRGLKGLARGLELAPLIAGPTALDQLGRHTEDGADGIARECARGRAGARRGGGPGRSRAWRAAARAIPAGAPARFVDDSAMGGLSSGKAASGRSPFSSGGGSLNAISAGAGRAIAIEETSRADGQDAGERATSHERPPSPAGAAAEGFFGAGAADFGPGFGWSAAGLSLAATAERRSFAQLRSVVSGLFAATSS